MFNLRVLLFLHLIIPSLTVNSQAIVKGVVIDNASEEPISKASIKLASSSEFVITKESGYELLRNKP